MALSRLGWISTRRVRRFVPALVAFLGCMAIVGAPPVGSALAGTGEEAPPPAWLDTAQTIQVGPDGQARSLYQPEFRPAPWLSQQLALRKMTGLTAVLVTPFVPVARPRGARKDPPPVPGRILLRGPVALVKRARVLLARLDVAPRSVLVSVLVTEVVRRRRQERGGSLFFDKVGSPASQGGIFRSFSTSFEPEGFLHSTLSGVTPFEGTAVTFGNDNVFGTAFETTLRFLQKEGEAEFLAWPSLLVNEGQPASITATRVVPQAMLQDSRSESITFRSEETGLKLKVTPRTIGREDAVLDLDVWLRLPEQVTRSDVLPGTLRLKLRQVTTRVTVRDREPLLIGGLVLRRAGRARRGLPRPAAADALDPLHSSLRSDHEETEIVFLVRARIVPPGKTPAELDPRTYRAWTAAEKLPDPWAIVKDPRIR